MFALQICLCCVYLGLPHFVVSINDVCTLVEQQLFDSLPFA